MQKITLSIVIPALNEEKNIGLLVKTLLQDLPLNHLISKIILVNDGSTDKTFEIMCSLKNMDSRIEVINHSKNKGIGHSLKSALDTLNEGCVLWLPSDGEFAPSELIKILSVADESKMIISYPENSKNVRPRSRYMLSRLYTSILNRIFKLNINYYNGITLYPVKFIKEIKVHSNRFSFCSELLLKCLSQGIPYREVPITLSPRRTGKSKAISLRSFIDVVLNFILFTLELKSFKRGKSINY